MSTVSNTAADSGGGLDPTRGATALRPRPGECVGTDMTIKVDGMLARVERVHGENGQIIIDHDHGCTVVPLGRKVAVVVDAEGHAVRWPVPVEPTHDSWSWRPGRAA